MNNKLRRQLILDHLRDARARLEGGSDPRRRQAERHVRYWSDQLNEASAANAVTPPPEAPAPAT